MGKEYQLDITQHQIDIAQKIQKLVRPSTEDEGAMETIRRASFNEGLLTAIAIVLQTHDEKN